MTKPQSSSSSEGRKDKELVVSKTLTTTNPPSRVKQACANHRKRDKLLEALLGLSIISSSDLRKKRIRRPSSYEPLHLIVNYIEKFLGNRRFLAGNIWPPLELWARKEHDGAKRVLNIAKKIRDEGIDLSHITSEFTTFTFYMEFDYKDLMDLTENLLSGMFWDLSRGRYSLDCHANGINKDPVAINFRAPFRRINMIEELEKIANLKIPRDFSSDLTNRYLIDACTKYGIECPTSQTTAWLLDKLVEHFLKEMCVNPTFIVDYPDIMSPPLAKSHILKPGLTEYFKLFINKVEVCNGYAAYNVPVSSQKRFLELKDRQFSEVELMALNNASESDAALPPTGCWGLGIDRLAILNTNWHPIKARDLKLKQNLS